MHGLKFFSDFSAGVLAGFGVGFLPLAFGPAGDDACSVVNGGNATGGRRNAAEGVPYSAGFAGRATGGRGFGT